jgi:hypothetical protein
VVSNISVDLRKVWKYQSGKSEVVTSEAGTTYPSGAPEFTPSF